MESIVISHKKMQRSLVAAFTMALNSAIKGSGYFFREGFEDETFQVQLWKSATKPEKGDARLIMDHSISKNRSEMNDIRPEHVAKFLEGELFQFVKVCIGYVTGQVIEPTPDPMPEKKTEEGGYTESPFVKSYGSDQFPGNDRVLIDIDGNRTDFKIGFYDTIEERWYLEGRTTRGLELIGMRWYQLPLSKYDKGKILGIAVNNH